MKIAGRWANFITFGLVDLMKIQARLIRAQEKEIESLKRVIECCKRVELAQEELIKFQDHVIRERW